MKTMINIFMMPVVLNIIKNAEKKIEESTGVTVKLHPVNTALAYSTDKPEIRLLKEVIYKYTHVEYGMMSFKSREPHFVVAREYYSWIAIKVIKGISVSAVAREFNITHASVLHYLDNIKEAKDKASEKWVELDIIINDFNNQLAALK